MNKDIGFKTYPELNPEYEDDNGLMYYSLKTDLVFHNGIDDITVKRVWNQTVFMTNLASTPKFMHWLIPPDNKYYKYPAVLHDFLYDSHDIKRAYADRMFRLAIMSEYKRKIQSEEEQHDKFIYKVKAKIVGWSFWAGVRLFGRWFRE